MTSRGIELTDRACWAILAAAMAVSAALLMYVSRGTTFGIDELVWVYQSPDAGLGYFLDPYNGSLIATNRIVYKAVLETVGAEYVAFRVLWVASVLACSGLLYALVKRRIGAVAALAPAVVLLFFGSAGEYFTGPIGFIAMFAIATGLGALLALERDDRVGDLAACVLVCVSVATFSIGLGFGVGVAISVLARRDRASRAWIFLVPLVLYGIWWLSARGDPGSASDLAEPSNVLLIPSYIADSLAASIAALLGLNYDFNGGEAAGQAIGWGYVLAALGVAALAVRITRGPRPSSLWVSLGIVLAVWSAGALVTDVLRPPDAPRYMYMGAIGVVLVATAAASSVRLTRLVLAILLVATATGLATNLAHLRERSAAYRDGYSTQVRTSFAMLELARDEVDPAYVPPIESFLVVPLRPDAGSYLEVADRYGSEALPLADLEREDLGTRERADETLAAAKDLELAAADDARTGARCTELRGAAAAAGIELPPGGGFVRTDGDRDATVQLGRFAPPSVSLGRLRSGRTAELAVEPDPYPRPWLISVEGAASVELCPLR